MKMTQESWERCLADYRESLCSPDIELANPTPAELPPIPKLVHLNRVGSKELIYNYLYLEAVIPKARLVVTNKDYFGTYGFWCPSSVTVLINEDEIHTTSWFVPKMIRIS